MFEEGNLLRFEPFLFKNGALPKPKYFVVIKDIDGDLLLASLPTSKDHVPRDIEMRRGCLDISERQLNTFVFLSNEVISIDAEGNEFAFPLDTFIYGADIDTYPVSTFIKQLQDNDTSILLLGKLQDGIFQELKECLKSSRMVKNKFRRLL